MLTLQDYDSKTHELEELKQQKKVSVCLGDRDGEKGREGEKRRRGRS